MMPVTNEEFRDQLRELLNDPAAQSEIRSSNPPRQALRAALNAIEDYFTPVRRLELKTAMEQASGLSLSNTMARKLFRVWMMLRWRSE